MNKKEYLKKWQQENADKVRKYSLDCYHRDAKRYNSNLVLRRRETLLQTTVDGKHVTIKVQKRPYPNKCELCKKVRKTLEWHHWDDEHPEWGLWICRGYCHGRAEAWENGTIQRYLELKKLVETNELR